MEIETRFFSNGCPLACSIVVPDGCNVEDRCTERREVPMVILCHGHSRDRNDGLDALAEVLAEGGLASLRFDFRGCGTSARERYALRCASEWPADLINALSFAETLPFVDSRRLGVAGISMGASTAVFVGGADSRIKSLVSMAGIADCEAWLRGVWERTGGNWDGFCTMIKEDQRNCAATGSSRLVRVLEMYNETEATMRAHALETTAEPGLNGWVSLASLGDLLRFRPIERCPSIHCPAFFIHGEDDTLVPSENSLAMYGAVPGADKLQRVYEGVDHNIPRHQKRAAVFGDILAWFTETIVS